MPQPTVADLAELKRLYNDARRVSAEITFEHGYISYPQPIRDLFNYISRSVWTDRGYDPSQVKPLLDRSASLTLDEIRIVLTGLNRIERFSAGAWQNIIEQDHISSLIARAENLLSEDNTNSSANDPQSGG